MQSELMALFGFNAEDLAANKSGRLSPRQREVFLRDDLGFYITLVVISIAALVGAVALVPIARDPLTRSPLLVWVSIAMLVVLAAWLLSTLFPRRAYPVENVRGTARLEKVLILQGATEEEHIWSHELIVKGIVFHIGDEAFRLIHEGDVYVIYCTKHLRHILSIDHIT